MTVPPCDLTSLDRAFPLKNPYLMILVPTRSSETEIPNAPNIMFFGLLV